MFQHHTGLSFSHPYPPTKLAFIPDVEGTRPDLLASASDFLRIWQIDESGVQVEKTLSTVCIVGVSIMFCVGINDWVAGVCFGHVVYTHARVPTHTAHPPFTNIQNRNDEYCAPLTSFDWNEADINRLGTSSIDTTCTIWDVEV